MKLDEMFNERTKDEEMSVGQILNWLTDEDMDSLLDWNRDAEEEVRHGTQNFRSESMYGGFG